MSETQDKTVREKLLDALKAESDQFTTEELIDQLIADRRRAKLEAYDHRQDLDDLRRVTQEARRVLVDALGEVTLTWSLDSLVRGVVESHTKYRKSYTEARSALIDALGEALTDWSLEDLVKAIIDQRDSWQRVAREQDAKEQDAKDDGVAELLRKTVKSPADEILELHAEIERLKDEIERLKDRAASVPAVLKSQADELLELYAEIERLKDCADSVPAVLNSTLTKTKEDLVTAKLEADRLDTALTRVNTVLSRFGVPRLAEGEHGPRMLEAHERVSILGVNAAQAKERADKSEALLATVAAADDFEKRAEKTAEYVDRTESHLLLDEMNVPNPPLGVADCKRLQWRIREYSKLKKKTLDEMYRRDCQARSLLVSVWEDGRASVDWSRWDRDCAKFLRDAVPEDRARPLIERAAKWMKGYFATPSRALECENRHALLDDLDAYLSPNKLDPGMGGGA